MNLISKLLLLLCTLNELNYTMVRDDFMVFLSLFEACINWCILNAIVLTSTSSRRDIEP
jgi:hypothetical protein